MMWIGAGLKTILSNDLVNFREGESAVAHDEFTAVTAGNGVYIAAAYNDHGVGKLYKSTDAVNWTEVAGINFHPYQVRYVNGYFFAVGWYNNGVEDHVGVLYSDDDGDTWTNISPVVGTTVAPGCCRDVAYLGGTYVVASGTSVYYNTALDTNWTEVVLGATLCARSITVSDTKFVVGGTGNTSVSTNGIAWNTYAVGVVWEEFVAICWDAAHQKFVIAGNALKYSDDGQTWTNGASYGTDNLTYMPDIGRIVLGSGASVGYSDDYCQTVTWINTGIAWGMNDGVMETAIGDQGKMVCQSAVQVVAAVGTVETIKDAATTGFTGIEQAYAEASVDGKIPSVLAEYAEAVRKEHLIVTNLCVAGGITPPAAFPTLATAIYDEMVQLQAVVAEVEAKYTDFAAAPTPTDQHQLDALAALAENLYDYKTAADEACERLVSMLDMWGLALP